MGTNDTWNFAAGAIAVLFIIYIPAKDELGTYLQMFLYTPPAGPMPTSSTPATVVGGALAGAGASGSAIMSGNIGSLFDPSQGLNNIWQKWFGPAPAGNSVGTGGPIK